MEEKLEEKQYMLQKKVKLRLTDFEYNLLKNIEDHLKI